MLNDMMAKGKTEKEAETTNFATFTQFCKSTTEEKTHSIATTKSEIDGLTADIAKNSEDIMVLEKEIAQHEADISAWTTEKEQATYEREKEHDDFVVEHKEYTESIDAVERAEENIKAGATDVSLVQQKASLSNLVSLAKVPESAKKALVSFLQGNRLDADLLEVGAPEAKKFESQSGGVLQMVEEMGAKMEDKREAIEKEEMNKKHAFDMMSQELTDSIENNQQASAKKASNKAEAAEAKAQAEGDLSAANTALAEDQKFLSDLNTECKQKSVDYEKRQQVRQGEVDAIQQAIEIMSGGAVGAGSQHLPGLVQKATSLAQLRSSSQNPAQVSVAEFLRGRASKMHSRMLSLMAVRVADDPFQKVTKMIKDMITKLMEEANEEAEHKGFCDTELGTNKNTRDALSEEAEELTAEASKLSADIAQLAEEISVLGEEIAAIDEMMAKATADRQAEKAKNEATIEDAKGAQAATNRAMSVLKTFYDKAKTATAFTQQPATFDKPYTGMEGGGIMGMLEVCE